MADFEKAFKITIFRNEGGYNPGVGEKETYEGIDRGANPHWPGWSIIDAIKVKNPGISAHGMNLLLGLDPAIQANIKHFYKVNYWDTFQGDKVADQQLANNLFDCSVNQGEGLARKIMQHACNYVSGKQAIVLDGSIGPKTLSVFNALPPAKLNAEINAERNASYRRDSGFQQWGKVWEKRLIEYSAC